MKVVSNFSIYSSTVSSLLIGQQRLKSHLALFSRAYAIFPIESFGWITDESKKKKPSYFDDVDHSQERTPSSARQRYDTGSDDDEKERTKLIAVISSVPCKGENFAPGSVWEVWLRLRSVWQSSTCAEVQPAEFALARTETRSDRECRCLSLTIYPPKEREREDRFFSVGSCRLQRFVPIPSNASEYCLCKDSHAIDKG